MGNDLTATGQTAWLRLKQHFVEAFTGEILSPRQSRDGDNKDEWRDSRRRNAYRYILILIAAVLVPLIIYDAVIGLVLPTLGLLLLEALILIDIVRLSRNREARVAPYWLLLICIGLVALSLREGIGFALYLLFPLTVALPILVSFRWALGLGVLGMVMVAPYLLAHYDPVDAAIMELSFALCWVASAWLVFALKQQTRKLHSMAITDPLTGAFNRRYFELQAERAFEAWTRYGTPVSIILMDIDHFKRINDAFGHSAGDQALKAFTECVSERVRRTDYLCRFGGEEFVLLLPETDGAQAETLAEKLREVVEDRPVLPQGKMTMSVGVCDASLALHTQHWFRLADNALYAAKSKGRNCVQLATGEHLKVVPLSKSVPQWR